jgi:xanthine dehydrogenase YagR molybdenum-binding subunit
MATGTFLIGAPVNRVDGRLKVTGGARYASEVQLAGTAHATLVGSAVASGRVTRLDVAAAEAAAGVLLVLTQHNRGPLGRMPTGQDGFGLGAEWRPPLADDRIHYHGQYVAMVVAETLEQARYAASLVQVEYDCLPFAVALADALETAYRPEQVFGEEMQLQRGDPAGALAAAELRLDLTYSTPNEHPCAMEPHATVAAWDGDSLAVHNSTQWVLGDRTVLAAAFELPPEKVRVLAPFVGGMFGSKVTTPWHAVLAAIAARRLERPVSAVLTRQQVLACVPHRPETVQRFELGAARDGTLLAMRHHSRTHTAENEFLDPNEFREPSSLVSRLLYACPSYETTLECVRLNVMKPGWMRAPGEATGMWALECAMDELACALDMDPVELRRRNHADLDPQRGKPFSSKHLLACYEQGAARFGWERRNPQPRSMCDGDGLVGWGMATASYSGWLFGATVRVRLERDGAGVRAVVSTAGVDIGTGMYTMMALTAADGLGLPLERVKAELGDTRLPSCAPAAGSNLTASTAPAIMDACAEIRRRLLGLAEAVPGFERATERAAELLFEGGRISDRSRPSTSIDYGELLARSGHDALEAEGKTEPKKLHDDHFTYQSFGAHFVEVRVHPDIGRIRVSRVVSVFDVGRVMNAKATRSQLIGGIVFGIGQALLEELVYDPAHGQAVNADLAGYLVPVHADVPEIEVSWLDEPDLNFNSVGCRGAGEIGITGLASAIANAVHHATGVRVRDLPITPEKLL